MIQYWIRRPPRKRATQYQKLNSKITDEQLLVNFEKNLPLNGKVHSNDLSRLYRLAGKDDSKLVQRDLWFVSQAFVDQLVALARGRMK